jgi:hypothetical protein
MRVPSFVTPRNTTAAVILTVGALAILIEYPGTIEYDAMAQLLEGRAGVYSFWHPPVMSWLLGLADAAVTGAGLFAAGQALTAFGALAALMWLPLRVKWTALWALPLLLLPQVFAFQGIVWKDVLFADASLAGFVLLALAAAHWNPARRRFALLGGSVLFLALAALTRQNGLLLVPAAALALGLVVRRRESSWRRGAIFGVAFFAATVAAVAGATGLLMLRHDGEDATGYQFKLLHVYDLTGMIRRNPTIELKVLDREAPEFARVIRGDGARLYSPERNDTMEQSQGIEAGLDVTPPDVLSRQWREAVLHHPGTWLIVRAEDFAWVFLQIHPERCVPFAAGVGNEPEFLPDLEMKSRFDARDRVLLGYDKFFVGTPFYSHAFFALIAIAALWPMARRRRSEDIAMIGMLGGLLAFAVSFFVISIACDYRYLYALDLGAVAAALYLAADWPGIKRAAK